MGETLQTGRKAHLDFLRLIAIYFVLFNHTGNCGFFLFPAATGIKQWIYAAISVSCTFAVPLFFMISGALLLPKDEPLEVVLKKRVLRFAAVLLGTSLLYWGYDVLVHGSPMGLGGFLAQLYSKDLSVALWYLYSYLSLLLMLPLLRRMARGMTDREFLYLGVLALIFMGILPIAEYLVFRGQRQLNAHLRGVLFTSENVVYFLMGYWFEHRLPERYRTWRTVAIGGALSVLAVLVSAGMVLYRGRVMGYFDEGEAQIFHKGLIAIPTYTIYLGAKRLFEDVRLSARARDRLTSLAGTTFGVFLLERILREQTAFLYDFLFPKIGPLPGSILWMLGAMVLGMALVWLLKKLPGLRTIL